MIIAILIIITLFIVSIASPVKQGVNSMRNSYIKTHKDKMRREGHIFDEDIKTNSPVIRESGKKEITPEEHARLILEKSRKDRAEGKCL